MADIEVTVFDATGNVVEHSVGPAQTATDEEIHDMIVMIEHGATAFDAAFLAKQHLE
jgi:hypothetical protein